FLQGQLATLDHFPLPVDGNAMAVAVRSHTRLGPSVSLAGAFAGPVQDRGNAAVRLLPGQGPYEVVRFRGCDPAMLAGPVLRHGQTGMVAALPVDHELDRVVDQPDDDLHDERAQDTLLCLRGCSGMVPQGLDVGAERHN